MKNILVKCIALLAPISCAVLDADKGSTVSDSPAYYRYVGGHCIDSQGREGFNTQGTECRKLSNVVEVRTLTGNWRGTDFGTVSLSGRTMTDIDLSGADLTHVHFGSGFRVTNARIDSRTRFPQCRAEVSGTTIAACVPAR